jgi:hypothetical protein
MVKCFVVYYFKPDGSKKMYKRPFHHYSDCLEYVKNMNYILIGVQEEYLSEGSKVACWLLSNI